MGLGIADVSLNKLGGIVFKEALSLFFNHALVAAIIVFAGVQSPAILKLKDLLLDEGTLVVFNTSYVVFLEIEAVEVEACLTQQLFPVEALLNLLVLGVVLQVGFEVVAVQLFLLSEGSREEGVLAVVALFLTLAHALLATSVVHGVHKLPRLELRHLAEVTIQLLDGHLYVKEILVVDLADGFPHGMVALGFQLDLLHGVLEHLHLILREGEFVHSVGRVHQHPVVFVGVDHRVVDVLRHFVVGVLVVSVHLLQGKQRNDVLFAHILVLVRVEVRNVVVHLSRVFVAESHQLEDLSADTAALERTLPQHNPHGLVSFVVVFVLRARAVDEAERRIRGEDHQRVVNRTEVH